MGIKNLLKRCLKFSNSGKKLKSSCSNSKLELNFDVSAFCVVFILAAAGPPEAASYYYYYYACFFTFIILVLEIVFGSRPIPFLSYLKGVSA